MSSSVCARRRQLPLIISFLALTLDRLHISVSLNAFGGSRANAERSLRPLCFLFGEHSSEEEDFVSARGLESSPKTTDRNRNAAPAGGRGAGGASLQQPSAQIRVHSDASLHRSRPCGASARAQIIYLDDACWGRFISV